MTPGSDGKSREDDMKLMVNANWIRARNVASIPANVSMQISEGDSLLSCYQEASAGSNSTEAGE
jgi:hypothetical protein